MLKLSEGFKKSALVWSLADYPEKPATPHLVRFNYSSASLIFCLNFSRGDQIFFSFLLKKKEEKKINLFWQILCLRKAIRPGPVQPSLVAKVYAHLVSFNSTLLKWNVPSLHEQVTHTLPGAKPGPSQTCRPCPCLRRWWGSRSKCP